VWDDYTLFVFPPDYYGEPTRRAVLALAEYNVNKDTKTVHVNMIWTKPKIRREGLATAIWKELVRLWPGHDFPRGWLTDEGIALRKSVGMNPGGHRLERSRRLENDFLSGRITHEELETAVLRGSLSEAQQFFYENAARSWDPGAGPVARIESFVDHARRLAAAERTAQGQGWTFHWDYDENFRFNHYSEEDEVPLGEGEDYFFVWMFARPDADIHEDEWDADLYGIRLIGIDSPYRRVIEAELALEELTEPRVGL
jgi:hypothetical protein